MLPVVSMSCSSAPLLYGKYGKTTLVRYAHAVEMFVAWCKRTGRSPSFADLDDVLATYLNDLYLRSVGGRGKTTAQCTVYGVVAIYPSMADRLSVSKRCVQSWDRLVPAVQYPPFTRDLACAVSVVMRLWGYQRYAVATLLAFHCMLRVGELCMLRKCDVGDDGDGRLGSAHRGVVLRLRKTKRGVNQSVRVDDPDAAALLRIVVRSTPIEEFRLFNFTPSSYRSLLKRVCVHLGLSARYVPHSLRHGGATYLHQLGVPVEDIMLRGRWASVKVTRRYIQDGESMLLSLSVPPRIAALAATASRNIISYLAPAVTRRVGRKQNEI
jgi:hypothetical protein